MIENLHKYVAANYTVAHARVHALVNKIFFMYIFIFFLTKTTKHRQQRLKRVRTVGGLGNGQRSGYVSISVLFENLKNYDPSRCHYVIVQSSGHRPVRNRDDRLPGFSKTFTFRTQHKNPYFVLFFIFFACRKPLDSC
uniref:Uncharacterized protein n=1 Tax=Sipha flava TaxID=143950 RepID=A0A2S2QNX0_9HEMI